MIVIGEVEREDETGPQESLDNRGRLPGRQPPQGVGPLLL